MGADEGMQFTVMEESDICHPGQLAGGRCERRIRNDYCQVGPLKLTRGNHLLNGIIANGP
jgi:hypothetical protein